jgi:3-hydroxybutyryl-CoA dehydrogenase
MIKVGIIGAGSMGSGIAQVAAQAGHEVVLFDTNTEQLDKAKAKLAKIMARLVEKGKIDRVTADGIEKRVHYSNSMNGFAGAGLVIEAIIENLEIKKNVFKELEGIVEETCILASNTSSLSIASIAAACDHAHRVIGIHFFNPAPLMPLVEIIPAVQTDENITSAARRHHRLMGQSNGFNQRYARIHCKSSSATFLW